MKKDVGLLLTCLGSIGVVGTGVSAAIQTKKGLQVCEKEQCSEDEHIRIMAKHYIPTVLIGVASVSCIFGARKHNEKVQAGFMSAYQLIESGYSNYRNGVKELFGDEADSDVMAKVAYGTELDLLMFEGEELFYDEFAGRYFKSTFEELDMAIYNANEILGNCGYVELNNLYDVLGLDPTEYGSIIGWSIPTLNAYGQTYIEYNCETLTTTKGIPYHHIEYNKRPNVDFGY